MCTTPNRLKAQGLAQSSRWTGAIRPAQNQRNFNCQTNAPPFVRSTASRQAERSFSCSSSASEGVKRRSNFHISPNASGAGHNPENIPANPPPSSPKQPDGPQPAPKHPPSVRQNNRWRPFRRLKANRVQCHARKLPRPRPPRKPNIAPRASASQCAAPATKMEPSKAYMGSARLRTDIPKLADLYLSGRLKLDEMISGAYPLEKINDAIADSRGGESLRNVIIFE